MRSYAFFATFLDICQKYYFYKGILDLKLAAITWSFFIFSKKSKSIHSTVEQTQKKHNRRWGAEKHFAVFLFSDSFDGSFVRRLIILYCIPCACLLSATYVILSYMYLTISWTLCLPIIVLVIRDCSLISPLSSLCLSVFLCLSVCLSVYLSPSVYLSVCVSVSLCLPVSLTHCL